MIGGSVARGLASRGVTVNGFDINSLYLDAAVAEGVVAQRLPADLSDLRGASAVVIAVYGDAALELLPRLESFHADLKVITDAGSTKRSIVNAAAQTGLADRFVGAHPFAGDHRSGWSASRFDLFKGETVYLCPTVEASDSAVSAAQELWGLLGAKLVKIDAAEHDDLLAWTSHLPHVMSTSLALALADAGVPHRQLGRGGRDVVRLAAGSPDVWTAVASDNAEAIESAIECAERQLSSFRELLRSGDRAALKEKFTRAQDWSGPSER
jgi:prephenate dehydrogenase